MNSLESLHADQRSPRTDAERLEWYVRYVAEQDEGRLLHYRRQPDKLMGITAFGNITEHDVWYWPLDPESHEFESFRAAIDWKMENK